MSSRRTAKAAEAIRETVSTTILFGLRDPRIQGVTVLSAEVSPDLRNAKVHVSIMGTDKQQSLAMHGLRSARGFLQSKLAERLQTRNTPVLEFVLDQGVKRSLEAARLLRESGTDFSAPLEEPRTGPSPESGSLLAMEDLVTEETVTEETVTEETVTEETVTEAIVTEAIEEAAAEEPDPTREEDAEL